MYTTLILKGRVKPEYRDAITKLMNYVYDGRLRYVYEVSDKWMSTGVDFMQQFAQVTRADFIPNGGDDLKWDRDSGVWEFETELKDYLNTYEQFFAILPLFMAEISELRTQYEEDDFWRIYRLEDDSIIADGIVENDDGDN